MTRNRRSMSKEGDRHDQLRRVFEEERRSKTVDQSGEDLVKCVFAIITLSRCGDTTPNRWTKNS